MKSTKPCNTLKVRELSAICRMCRTAEATVRLPYARRSLCPSCFLEYYVRRIRRTVESFKMFNPDDSVAVAVSGGKDSAALLHGLSRGFPALQITAVHVDLGIKGYSESCRDKVEALTAELDTDLQVLDVKKELGFTISDFRDTRYRRKICSTCGTIKRHLFEVLAHRAAVNILATGHNLDDFLGTMFNNLFSGNWRQLIRVRPILQPVTEKQTTKVKPLIKTPENDNRLYCLYSGIAIVEGECPYTHNTRIARTRRLLNTLSTENSSFRHQMLTNFLALSRVLEGTVEQIELRRCEICGFPTSLKICAYCRRVDVVRKSQDRSNHSQCPEKDFPSPSNFF